MYLYSMMKYVHLIPEQFDPEGFGEIEVDDFIQNVLKSPEFQVHVPPNKRELLYERAIKAKLPKGPGSISFQDFVNVVSVYFSLIYLLYIK